MLELTRKETEFIIDALEFAGQNWHSFCDAFERDKTSEKLEEFAEMLEEKLLGTQ